MEEKIEIKVTATEEDLLDIINNNTPEAVAKAFHAYIIEKNGKWYKEYDRANKAEKELASIKDAIVAYAVKRMKE